ncbi:hypothetical protein [Rhizobium sp. Leaf341]|uniref:hypothetical protein n=1 Tax=Rhizobium sp. Leaf341 TaxID=1736344 RepID=UPI000715ACF1|nr:hypothetical protein [Rhizobium sp. Leaf341]KQR75781.1 hypothetical protein ASG03_19120 [Rhizobium sp. Leaf341]
MFERLDKISVEDVRSKRDAAQARADGWWTKLLTSLSAGAGAGLIAVLAFLATKLDLSPVATLLGVLALIAFFTALWFNALAMMHMFNIANFTVGNCENEMQRRATLAMIEPMASPEDLALIKEGLQTNYDHGEKSIEYFHKLAGRRTMGTLITLLLGCLLFFSMIVISSNALTAIGNLYEAVLARFAVC